MEKFLEYTISDAYNRDCATKAVNDYLAEGWTVKHLTALAGDSSVYGSIFLVIEKKDDIKDITTQQWEEN